MALFEFSDFHTSYSQNEEHDNFLEIVSSYQQEVYLDDFVGMKLNFFHPFVHPSFLSIIVSPS